MHIYVCCTHSFFCEQYMDVEVNVATDQHAGAQFHEAGKIIMDTTACESTSANLLIASNAEMTTNPAEKKSHVLTKPTKRHIHSLLQHQSIGKSDSNNHRHLAELQSRRHRISTGVHCLPYICFFFSILG